MFTRKQRLDEECTHEQYYDQFVDEGTIKRVSSHIGKKAILESTDENFNDIPLYKWDQIFMVCPAHTAGKIRAAGDYITLAGMVCLAKAAARQIKAKG